MKEKDGAVLGRELGKDPGPRQKRVSMDLILGAGVLESKRTSHRSEISSWYFEDDIARIYFAKFAARYRDTVQPGAESESYGLGFSATCASINV